jgi:hypothetical protein
MKRYLIALAAMAVFAIQGRADYIYTTIDMPGAAATELHGINDLGQIVGQAFTGGLGQAS